MACLLVHVVEEQYLACQEVAGQYLACLLHSEEKMLAQEEEWSIERIQSGIVSSSNIPPSSNSIILT